MFRTQQFLKGKMDEMHTYMYITTRVSRPWSGVKGTQKKKVQKAESGSSL